MIFKKFFKECLENGLIICFKYISGYEMCLIYKGWKNMYVMDVIVIKEEVFFKVRLIYIVFL